MLTKADIRLVRSLADKRARTDEGLFVAEGGKLIGELRASTLRIRRIYALDGVFAGEDVTTVSPKEMERLSLLKTPSDSLALVEIPRRRLDPAKLRRSLVLALDDVQNPGNLGTIVRLADWFGIGDVVCSEATADCFNPKVVQATMGAILRVRVHYCDLEAYLAAERAAGTPIYGTFLEGDDIYRTQLSPTGIVLMGNEGRGVTPACAAQVTRKLFIPPYPAERHATESLNVAMATGLVCAEFRRQARAGREGGRRPDRGGRERSDLRSAAHCRFVRIVVRATVRPSRHRKNRARLFYPADSPPAPQKKSRHTGRTKPKSERPNSKKRTPRARRDRPPWARNTPHHKPESHPRRNIRPLRSTTNTTLPFLRHSMQPLRLVPTFD